MTAFDGSIWKGKILCDLKTRQKLNSSVEWGEWEKWSFLKKNSHPIIYPVLRLVGQMLNLKLRKGRAELQNVIDK